MKCKLFMNSYEMEIEKLRVPTHSVIFRFESGAVLVCKRMFFNKKENRWNRKIELFCYDPIECVWIKTRMQNEITDKMVDFYIQKINAKYNDVNFKALMKHDRMKKKGSGGIRLSKWNGTVTDYECAKNPLHDFRRVFY